MLNEVTATIFKLSLKFEERKKLERNDLGVSEDLSECAAPAHDSDDGGLIPQRKSGHPDHQQLPSKEEGDLE